MALPPLLWASSYIWTLGVRREGGTRDYDVWVGRGGIYGSIGEWAQTGPWTGDPRWYPFLYRTPGGSRGFELYDKGSVAGFNGQGLQPNREGNYWGFIRVPLWLPSCVNLLAGFWLFRRAQRKRKHAARLRNGLCLTCGYDLRVQKSGLASDKCPECGSPIPAPSPSPRAPPDPSPH